MKIKDKQYRTIWLHPENDSIIQIIDQRWLPHRFVIADLKSVDDVCVAIKEMWVRGAPLIGAAAAWGMYLATVEAPDDCDRDLYFEVAYGKLLKTRPTAINLKWALDEMLKSVTGNESIIESRWYAKKKALWLCDDDVKCNKLIGTHGTKIIEEIAAKKNGEINILTHCNAGWLATVDRGTATAPIYSAKEKGIDIHIYVSETRPRNQGAQLTAWELLENDIPHTLIVDNAAGYLLQNQKIDLVLTGTDRTSLTGDVVNKIGTYLKALAAYDNHIPFYVAAPSSSIDFNMRDANEEIIIEERDPDEVRYVQGLANNKIQSVLISPVLTRAINYGFDITPARYVTGLITERGVCEASEEGIKGLFPDKKTQ
jgi:methylthioribose-1-phosphate isomerase